MGRTKASKPGRARRPLSEAEELPHLAHSPARTLFTLAEKGLDDQEARAISIHWPYTLRINTATRTTSLAEAAQMAKTGINETAEGMVMMEEQGFLVWDSDANEYHMLTPAS